MLPLLLPVCLSLSSPQVPPGGNPVSEVFAVQHLLGEHPAQETPPWGSLLQRQGNPVDLLGVQEESATATAEEVAQMLRELAGEPAESGALHLAALGQSVLAVGDQAEVAKVGARIRAAGALLARPLQIEFAVWDAADREACPAVLTPAEFARFAGNRAPLWLGSAVARSGHAVALQRMRWTRYVRDLDVEVAQKQSITAPATDEFGEGSHAVVRAFQLLGDDFAVHAQFVVGQRRGVVRTLQTGMAGAADLELPTLETDYGACSGRIPDGGALAVTLRGHPAGGGQRILTVRVRGLTAAPASHTLDGLGIFPCGALTSGGLDRQLPPPVGDQDETEVEPGASALPPEALVELLVGSLGEAGERAGLRCRSGHLFARGDAVLLARVEALLRGLQDRLVRTVTVVHTGALQPAEASSPPATPLHELCAPTLLGRTLTLGRCLETNVVARLLCVIAQEASVLDPDVDVLASGAWLRARVAPADDGMHLQLQLQHRHAQPPQTRSVMPVPGGVLMATDVALTGLGHDGVVGNGQPVAHGDGPAVTLEGRGYRSALATLVRW